MQGNEMLDLKDLERRLDQALKRATPESLRKWLSAKEAEERKAEEKEKKDGS
jgi:hypothetical protein